MNVILSLQHDNNTYTISIDCPSAIRGVRLRELIVAQGAQRRCALLIALVRIPQP